jgi:hypothetical protein
MKRYKSSAIVLGLVMAGMHSASAFWFRPILEVQHNMSDRNATLALLEKKKYRVKFYNVDCASCKTIIVADPEIAKFINIRTTIKKVRSKANLVHHVIEVNKIYEPINTKLIIKSIDESFIDEINLDLNTVEACRVEEVIEEEFGIESIIIEDIFEEEDFEKKPGIESSPEPEEVFHKEMGIESSTEEVIDSNDDRVDDHFNFDESL